MYFANEFCVTVGVFVLSTGSSCHGVCHKGPSLGHSYSHCSCYFSAVIPVRSKGIKMKTPIIDYLGEICMYIDQFKLQ